MKTLLLALASETFYPPALLPASEQLFIGPDVAANTCNAIYSQLHGLPGPDLTRVLEARQWQPDLTFVKADASCRNHIRQISALPGRKVLLMGDTHHLQKPLQTMLAYAQSEPWDLISSEHDRHHLPLFADAGLSNLIWLPCFTMNPQRLSPQPALDSRPVFVGSLSPHHLHRQRLLAQLQTLEIDLYITTAPQAQAAQLYNRHAISLNVSLNGDLNFRIVEVLAAGGCLLTDRLGPDSGLNLLLQENVHYLAYSSAAEAAEIIKWLILNPQRRLAIAQAGHQRFWNHFSPHIQAQILLAALNGEPIPPLFKAPR